MTLENYTEKYIPIKMESMILDNLKLIISKENMQKLKSVENKVY